MNTIPAWISGEMRRWRVLGSHWDGRPLLNRRFRVGKRVTSLKKQEPRARTLSTKVRAVRNKNGQICVSLVRSTFYDRFPALVHAVCAVLAGGTARSDCLSIRVALAATV